MFLHNVLCREANIGRSIIPGHESGMERRREDHHLQSSHFFIQSQEKRVDSGQCGHSLETGDLQTRKLIEYFVVRHHKPRHSPQPFLRTRLSSTAYVIGKKITALILSTHTVLLVMVQFFRIDNLSRVLPLLASKIFCQV